MNAEYPQAPLDPTTQLEEIVAVWEAQVEGFVYDDGEVWASVEALEQWRKSAG